MRFESFGVSDKGLVRKRNEDYYAICSEDGLFLIADGMGGLSQGERASRIAVSSAERFVRESRKDDITWPVRPKPRFTMEENRLFAAFSLANWRVYTEFLRGGLDSAMGTTMVGLLVDGKKMVIANVGDSRAYLIRNDVIRQVTRDHSPVMEDVMKGVMTMDQARANPERHVLSRALGVSDRVRADISSIGIRSGDLFLLCSDGLSDMLTDQEMVQIARSGEKAPLRDLGEALIRAANSNGGKDNVTVVLVRSHRSSPPDATDEVC
jgi:PPM family protein phosphatase